jgi:O-antigen/teichoic acid export membrane protein
MPSLIKDSTVTLIARGLALGLSAASTVIISRELQPALKGSYSILMLIMTITLMLSSFGVGSANVYLGARKPENLPTLAGNSFPTSLGLGLLGALVVEALTLVPAFQAYLVANGVPVEWVRWLILLLPLLQLEAYLREIVRAAGRLGQYNLLAVIEYLSVFVGLIILVVGLHGSITGAIYAWAIGQTITALVTIWLALRAAGGRLRFEWQTLRQSFMFGLRLHPGTVAQFLNYRLDLFLVGLFLSPTEVGLYATATVLAEMLWEIPNAIRTVLMYQVSADYHHAIAMTARVSRVIFALIGGLCLLVAVFGYPLIGILYGETYVAAAPVLTWLLPGIWVLGSGKLLAVYLAANGKPEVATLSALVSLVSTVLLDLLLIPHIGIVGAAIASSFSYFLATVVVTFVFLRSTRLSLSETFLLRYADILFVRRALANGLQRRFPHLFAPSGN